MEPVQSIEHLYALSLDKRAVISSTSAMCFKPRPAAFMINLPVLVLLKMVKEGLYIYEKPAKNPRRRRYHDEHK